jgi:hypothetical protein
MEGFMQRGAGPAGASSGGGTLSRLLLPLAHLDGVYRMINSDLLERLAATDRLHGDLGLELGAMGAVLAYRWEPPFKGGAPPQRLTLNPVQKTQSTSDPERDHKPTRISAHLKSPSNRCCQELP